MLSRSIDFSNGNYIHLISPIFVRNSAYSWNCYCSGGKLSRKEFVRKALNELITKAFYHFTWTRTICSYHQVSYTINLIKNIDDDLMQKNEIVLSFIADDHPGIVKTLSDTISDHGGNWLNSSLSHLEGKFAGIILLEVTESKERELENALHALGETGIQINFERTSPCAPATHHFVKVNIVANDRPGIIQEIADILASRDINIEKLTTAVADSPMSSGHLFKANFQANLPDDMDYDDFQHALERVSDDLIVELDEG